MGAWETLDRESKDLPKEMNMARVPGLVLHKAGDYSRQYSLEVVSPQQAWKKPGSYCKIRANWA